MSDRENGLCSQCEIRAELRQRRTRSEKITLPGYRDRGRGDYSHADGAAPSARHFVAHFPVLDVGGARRDPRCADARILRQCE
jgi:hypothetical protein